MTIDRPAPGQETALRALWKEAFGDPDSFLDTFFETAYSPERCRCVTLDGVLAAALYWLDCEYMGQKLAYIYAVATAKAFRGRGLCHTLMADAHRVLKDQGYAGALLVPQSEKLETLYGSMGYRSCTQIREFVCGPQISDLQVTRVHKEEYARLRREMLPSGGVVQEGAALEFLASQARFYAGNGFLLAGAVQKDVLYGLELLGDVSVAPALVALLGCAKGQFRTPGAGKPFAMYRTLGDAVFPAPAYFAFAFD